MSLSVSTQVSPVGNKLIVQTSATATADNNVTGEAGAIYNIELDNSSNSSSVYLKIYDNASPVVGTTAPDHTFRVKGNQLRSVVAPQGLDFDYLSFACVTTGGTAGTTSPTNPVIVRMVTT